MIVSFQYRHQRKRNAVKRLTKIIDDDLGYKVIAWIISD